MARPKFAELGQALAQTVKKHEPSLEDVVRETLRPLLKSCSIPLRQRSPGKRQGYKAGSTNRVRVRLTHINGVCLFP